MTADTDSPDRRELLDQLPPELQESVDRVLTSAARRKREKKRRDEDEPAKKRRPIHVEDVRELRIEQL
jgi:hypothetical protein